MRRLGSDEAVRLVRKNLDEQEINYSDMYNPETEMPNEDSDSENLDSFIEKTLPEAINIVQMVAPSIILDGMDAVADGKLSIVPDGDVLGIVLDDTLLRLVNFRAFDSNLALFGYVSEDSAEARMQLNPYSRASYDRPVLVRIVGREISRKTYFKYYCTKYGITEEMAPDAVARFEYIPEYHYSPSVTEYNVSEQLVDRVIYQLTGMCLAVLGNLEQAKYFMALASFTENNAQ